MVLCCLSMREALSYAASYTVEAQVCSYICFWPSPSIRASGALSQEAKSRAFQATPDALDSTRLLGAPKHNRKTTCPNSGMNAVADSTSICNSRLIISDDSSPSI
ncbi:unnamed protein product [Phytophthora fragariaefolia]|uniref:Unnamed protein product n=1 Tax=Phytophthora fragariaefolia TaxID=1490495 RepID=A0A9W6XQ27_9STRA|nr:unnamed protein product [Phytophthora fragariaefolia]